MKIPERNPEREKAKERERERERVNPTPRQAGEDLVKAWAPSIHTHTHTTKPRAELSVWAKNIVRG